LSFRVRAREQLGPRIVYDKGMEASRLCRAGDLDAVAPLTCP